MELVNLGYSKKNNTAQYSYKWAKAFYRTPSIPSFKRIGAMVFDKSKNINDEFGI